ncbi:zinc finger protein swm [Galendromus occidentalis]|uniref:Zinc finger protein swm n=1 Tax=Galendromus occidentalis TaxID=34638 RepID=A0AAJ7L8P1_9ACAR|nr:zinc finger protein swm [Galendromus occidentalis]
MVIQPENIDLLKTWLKSCLVVSYGWGSDCDNLTKYVVALVRKAKTTDDLKKQCGSNLEVFFRDNTQKFVTELCGCIESKSYMQPYGSPAAALVEKLEDVAFIVDKKPDPMLKERERSRSRSPRRKSRSPKRSRSPPSRRFRSRSRSRSRERHRRKRSRSPRRRRYSRSRSPPPASNSAAATTSAASRRTPPRDLRDTLIRKQCGPQPGMPPRQRCRDFDEQGFCIQGELCPFDHGSDPVILDSTVPPPYNPMRGPVAPVVPEYNPMEPEMRHPPPSFNNWNYQPGPPAGGPMGMNHGHHREAMSTVRNVTPLPRSNVGAQGDVQKPRFQRGTELEVRKIPRAQNNIATLNEFFSKFGTVTNIQVNFQGCPESALVSFSNHGEANAAYRSPEAVLGNRFIRLFWHNTSSGNVQQSNQNPHWMNNNNNNSGSLAHRHPAPPGALRDIQGGGKQHARKDDGPPAKKMAKPNPESMKKDNQAEKSKQFVHQKGHLIDQYLEKQRILKEKLEKCQTEGEKEEIQHLIKNLSDIVESFQSKTTSGPLMSEIQTEKELLDAELDVYRQIQEGTPAESKEIKFKLNALRRRAKTLGLIDSANAWHGKMAHKNLLLAHQPKPKLQPAQLQLDKRTKVVAVQAGDLEMAGLCKHFSRFGKILNVTEEGVGAEKVFVFTFATRKFAETAVNRGSHFRGITLKWSWKQEEEPASNSELSHPPPTGNDQKKAISEIDASHRDSSAIGESDALLAEDDEAEDEEGPRSWRH